MMSYHLQPPPYAPEPIKALAYNPVNHLDSRDERMLLSTIKLPALVINGRQDPIIPPEVGEMTHEGIQSSKFLLLDDCGHFPFSEQPEKTTQAVLDFIRGR
jgi:pimeloyl-ACP methyl ester carboxylesterase